MTRAAARSLVHDTSVKVSRPREPHSSTARKTAPYPDGPDEDGFPSGDRDPEDEESWQPATPANTARSAPAHRKPSMATMAEPPERAPSVTRWGGRTPGAWGALGQMEVARRRSAGGAA
ncbi:hypothetical protein GCM10010277_16540 [Streptomyces longisporoflavus]|nr:hypothetical protein GCM10010277_16540 [Streptomyces longisporoflavus]